MASCKAQSNQIDKQHTHKNTSGDIDIMIVYVNGKHGFVFIDANTRSRNSSSHALRDNRAATQNNVFAAFRMLNLCAAWYLTRAPYLGCASITLQVIKYDLCAACYQRLALSYAADRSGIVTPALIRGVATSWQAAPNTWTRWQTRRRCADRLTQTATPPLVIESRLSIQRQ
jgi:hypothetical protein